MSGVPRLEFSREIFLPSLAQFCHYSGVVGRQPVVELIQRFDGCEHFSRNFDDFARHGAIVRLRVAKHNDLRFHEGSLTKKVISDQ